MAKDGFEALDVFKKSNPAVVLLDVMMFGMDGSKYVKKSVSSRMYRLFWLRQR